MRKSGLHTGGRDTALSALLHHLGYVHTVEFSADCLEESVRILCGNFFPTSFAYNPPPIFFNGNPL